MTFSSRTIGARGEHIAQAYLLQKGFQAKALNWRLGRTGEIDLIVYHPLLRILAFVEVKTRKSMGYGSPAESITERKVRQLSRLGEAYLQAYPPDPGTDVRFDVIGIYFAGGGKPAVIDHLEGAFEPVSSG